MEKKIDIVVAVRDEVECIPLFIQQIKKLPIPQHVIIGFIFVEDSSVDGTKELLKEISAIDNSVVSYSLSRGHGQGVAMAYGVKRSSADAVIVMDVDGEHPVDLIPTLIMRYLEGYDVVQAVRKIPDTRLLYRKLGSLFFNYLMGFLTGIQLSKQNVSFLLISQNIYKLLLKDHRWPIFLRIRYSENKSWNIAYEEFYVGGRLFGESKYNLKRLLKLSIQSYFSSVSFFRFYLLIFTILLIDIASFYTPFYGLSILLTILIVSLISYFLLLCNQSPFSKIELE